MNSKLKMLGALVLIGFIFFLNINSENDINSVTCSRLEEFKNEEYNDRILTKYIDQRNHRFRTIKLNRDRRATIVLVRDTSAFYDFIQPNDSIVKKKGTDVVTVYRLKTVSKFKIYFGCTE